MVDWQVLSQRVQTLMHKNKTNIRASPHASSHKNKHTNTPTWASTVADELSQRSHYTNYFSVALAYYKLQNSSSAEVLSYRHGCPRAGNPALPVRDGESLFFYFFCFWPLNAFVWFLFCFKFVLLHFDIFYVEHRASHMRLLIFSLLPRLWVAKHLFSLAVCSCSSDDGFVHLSFNIDQYDHCYFLSLVCGLNPSWIPHDGWSWQCIFCHKLNLPWSVAFPHS